MPRAREEMGEDFRHGSMYSCYNTYKVIMHE